MKKEKLQQEGNKIIGKGRKALRYGVNIFIFTFLFIFMLLMIFFGVSQTSFFKSWLRDFIVETVNDEINGKLSIGEIEGTIFTSLIIKNTTLSTLQNDTVVSADKIELRTSPLKILFKNIYVRKFELKSARIKLVEEEDGELNLLKIFPASDEPEDTTSSEFPFTIEAADFALTDVDFSLQKFDKIGSTASYPDFNTSDLRIKDLNLKLNAFADLNKYNYRLTIDDFSFSPNFDVFQLKSFSGTFLITPNLAGINKLRLKTDESDVEINAAVLGVDFLNNFSTESLAEAPIRISMDAPSLNFADISTFVPAMNMLNGSIAAQIETSGTLSDLQIKNLDVLYNNTRLTGKANLKNLLDVDNMFFDVSLNDSYLDPSDPNKLLAGFDLPEFNMLGVVKFDTLSYKGGPLNFNSKFALKTNLGDLSGEAKLDLRPKDMLYAIKLKTSKLDLSSFISIPTNFNSSLAISGTGFNPDKMKMELALDAGSSVFGSSFLRDLKINSKAENGLITSSIYFSGDTSSALINADIDFTNSNDPSYEIKGRLSEINLARLLSDSSLESDINLSFDVSGQGFDPDSIDLFLVTDIKNTKFSDFDIDSTRVILDVRRNDNGNKIVNLISDIADFTINGNFELTTLGSVFSREAEILNKNITDRYLSVFDSSSVNFNKNVSVENNINEKIQDFAFTYLLDFKESVKIAFGKSTIELDGLVSGKISSKDEQLLLDMDSDFGYLKFLTSKDVYFLINTSLDFNLSNSFNLNDNDILEAGLKLTSDRIYAGSNLYNLDAELNVDNNKLNSRIKMDIEKNLKTDLTANIRAGDQKLFLEIPALQIIYNALEIKNSGNIEIAYHDKTISFDRFLLDVAGAELEISGESGFEGNHEASITLKSLEGEKVIEGLLAGKPERKIQSDINLSGSLTGNFSDPVFNINASIEGITYGNSNFGSLFSVFDYENNSLNTDIRLLDSTLNFNDPALTVNGYIPLTLSSSSDSVERSERSINLSIESDEFDLSSLKDIIPFVQFNKGKLETEIDLSGTLSQPIAMGYFSINDASFKVTNNNLDYNLQTKVWIDDEDVTIEKIELKNAAGTKNGGTLTGNGFVKLNEFKLDSTFLTFSGELKVLDQISKTASPIVYGDVAIRIRDAVTYSANKNFSYLNLPIDVTTADLIVPLSSSAYSSSSGFIYKYEQQDLIRDQLESELDSIISARIKKDSINSITAASTKFNYTVDIKLATEAEIVVILSKELDQKFLVMLGGDFFLQSFEGKQKSGGELTLLPGSTLSFIKSFDATGNIKFDKIDDPIVNITSTYKDYYSPPGNGTGQSEQEVAVKIKLKGPLSELNKNFISDEDNVGVYMGRQNIDEDKKDPSKNVTDAMFFILQGKFPNDENVTEQDKNLFASTATSLAGSLIGSVLNKYFDDYVKGFQLRQTATETKFNLIGKAGKLRYEIGGSTEVLQDLSRANVRLEYPLTQRFQLRLERKESENESSSFNNPLFFEGGLKYNFEF
ncbi:MAG: hypothetical protein M5U17_01665 [Ignavibacterium sp.]|nr:hypothetical protein [Ignavibacterium sp.]